MLVLLCSLALAGGDDTGKDDGKDEGREKANKPVEHNVADRAFGIGIGSAVEPLRPITDELSVRVPFGNWFAIQPTVRTSARVDALYGGSIAVRAYPFHVKNVYPVGSLAYDVERGPPERDIVTAFGTLPSLSMGPEAGIGLEWAPSLHLSLGLEGRVPLGPPAVQRQPSVAAMAHIYL